MKIFKLDSYGRNRLASVRMVLEKEYQLTTAQKHLHQLIDMLLLADAISEVQITELQNLVLEMEQKNISDQADDVWSDSCVCSGTDECNEEHVEEQKKYSKRIQQIEENNRQFRLQTLAMKHDEMGNLIRHINRLQKEKQDYLQQSEKQENAIKTEDKEIRRNY